jgi:hypothetical protein
MNKSPATETTDMPLDNLTSFEIATFKGSWKVEVEHANKQSQELKSERFQHLPRWQLKYPAIRKTQILPQFQHAAF